MENQTTAEKAQIAINENGVKNLLKSQMLINNTIAKKAGKVSQLVEKYSGVETTSSETLFSEVVKQIKKQNIEFVKEFAKLTTDVDYTNSYGDDNFDDDMAMFNKENNKIAKSLDDNDGGASKWAKNTSLLLNSFTPLLDLFVGNDNEDPEDEEEEEDYSRDGRNDPYNSNYQKRGMSGLAIAGIVFGSLVLIGGTIVIIIKSKNKKSGK